MKEAEAPLPLTREEILAGVERLGPWFHRIELGQGIVTKSGSLHGEEPEYPRPLWRAVRDRLPADLTGKSVLDVGCNAGFFSVEAKRRNAARVLGVDAARHVIDQARFVNRVLGLDLTFRRLSVYDLTPRTVGHFHVTLALGLIYHCRHPLLALEKLFLVTREMLILESAILPKDAPLKAFEFQGGAHRERIQPIGYVENPPGANVPAANWFVPSRDCLAAMARDLGFVDIHVETLGPNQERALLVCRKPTVTLDSRSTAGLGASLTLAAGSSQGVVGQPWPIRLIAENTGRARWLGRASAIDGRGLVRVAANVYRDDEELAWDYFKVRGGVIEADVDPGERVELDFALEVPERPGSYQVQLEMLADGVGWFHEQGSEPLIVHFEAV